MVGIFSWFEHERDVKESEIRGRGRGQRDESFFCNPCNYSYL